MMWVWTSFHSFKAVNLFHGARDVTDIRFLLQNQSSEYGYIYEKSYSIKQYVRFFGKKIDMMRLAQFKIFVQKHRILLNKNMATGLDICQINSILFDCFQHLNEMNQTTSKQQNVLS